MADTPSSAASSPREEEDSPRSPPCPPLSATRVKLCDKCGDSAPQEGQDVCRDCEFAEPSSCEHCEEAKRIGKAAVCSCEKNKPPKKKQRFTMTPPTTPAPFEDVE
jgi:hypothetical protein